MATCFFKKAQIQLYSFMLLIELHKCLIPALLKIIHQANQKANNTLGIEYTVIESFMTFLQFNFFRLESCRVVVLHSLCL